MKEYKQPIFDTISETFENFVENLKYIHNGTNIFERVGNNVISVKMKNIGKYVELDALKALTVPPYNVAFIGVQRKPGMETATLYVFMDKDFSKIFIYKHVI